MDQLHHVLSTLWTPPKKVHHALNNNDDEDGNDDAFTQSLLKYFHFGLEKCQTRVKSESVRQKS